MSKIKNNALQILPFISFNRWFLSWNPDTANKKKELCLKQCVVELCLSLIYTAFPLFDVKIYLSDARFRMLVTGAIVPPEIKVVLPVFLGSCANNFLLTERGGCKGEFSSWICQLSRIKIHGCFRWNSLANFLQSRARLSGNLFRVTLIEISELFLRMFDLLFLVFSSDKFLQCTTCWQ